MDGDVIADVIYSEIPRLKTQISSILSNIR